MTFLSCPALNCSLPLFLTDPHIKVSGKREDVQEAKEKIMSVLDTKVTDKVKTVMEKPGLVWACYKNLFI